MLSLDIILAKVITALRLARFAHYCLLLILTPLTSLAQGNIINIDGSKVVDNFCRNVFVLEDPYGTFTIDQVASFDVSDKFCLYEKPNLIFSNTSYYWIKLVLHNDSGDRCFLKLDQPIIEFVDFFTRDNGNWVDIKSGYSVSIEERNIKTPHPFFVIEKGSGVYYLKIKGNHLAVPLVLIPNKLVAKSGAQKNVGVSIILGILIMTFLYYSVLGYKFRSVEFFSYCLTVLGYIGGAFWLEGYGLYFTHNKYFETQNFISSTAIVFLGWFGYLFLGIGNCQSALIRFLYRTVILVYGIMALVSLFGLYGGQVFILWQVLFSTLLLFNITYGFVCYKRTRNAIFIAYSAAYLLFLVFAVLELLHLNRGLPHYLPVLYVSLGYTSETLMLGYALIMKFENAFESERAAKEAAIFKNLTLTENLNRELELTVQNRTAELLERTDLLKIQNAKLVALDEEKNRMLHIVSHDLKSPINNILGLAKLIEREKEGSDTNIYVEKIIQSANRLKGMVVSILDLEAIERGGITLNLEPINLCELLNDVCDEFRQQAANKGITIETYWKETDSFIRSDKQYFFQVMSNLISNALKFSNRNSKITIELESDSKTSAISISDQGPGISDEDRPKLFKKFQKLTARPTDGENSTGLGLAIAKELVERMGGQISCESRVGFGTKFIVKFPVLHFTKPVL